MGKLAWRFGHNEKARQNAGPLLEWDGSSGFQQGPQPLGNRLIQHMIVDRVQQVFAMAVAGEERPDLIIDRVRRRSGFDEAAFDGEVHGKRAFLKRAVFPCGISRHN